MADSLLEAPPFLEDVAASVIVDPSEVAVGGSDGGGDAGVGSLPPAAMQFADLTESGSESDEVSAEPQQAQQEQQGQPAQQQQQDSDASPSAEPNTPAARSSPPPNCAICLSRCRRKCFTDSCMHQFCFKCLCEWSKIKPECPLCKQPFKTIIHNVRTLQDYDRYPVQANTPDHSALSFHIVNIRRQRFMLQNLTNELNASATDESQDGVNLNALPNRMHVPFNRFEPYRMELLNMYRQDQDSGRGGSGTGSLSQLWRRYVYDRKLYALPVSDSLTGHFREWSARFYRDNPAQMHRLMPWINRDIVCLLRNSTQNVSDVMQLMHDILPMINIPTRTFRRRLSPFLGERTNHFIHELFNFARSPYDMIGYDRVVQYSARVAEEVEVDLLDLVSNSNDNGSGSGSAQPPTDANGNGNNNNNGSSGGGSVSGNNGSNGGNSNISDLTGSGESSGDWGRLPRPSTSVIVTNPSSTHSFSVTMATDGSELPGISIRRTTTSNVGSQTVAINLSMRRSANEVIEIDDGDAAANAEVAAINDTTNQTGRRQAGASLPISAHIELQSSDCSNSSDDDECVFVLERKPPHLRTPELVSLDSNSDSDVVFVDEQKAKTPPKPTSATSDATNLEPSLEDAAAAAADLLSSDMFMGPSTSTGVCSTSGKHWKTVLEEARRQDATRRTRHSKRHAAARAQQRSQLAAVKASSSSSSSSSSATNWTTTNDDEDNNLERATSNVAKHWKKVLEEARRLEAAKQRSRHPKRNAATRAQQRSQFLIQPSSGSNSSATIWTTTNDEDSSSDDSNWATSMQRKKSKKRTPRKPKTRKRSANAKTTPAQPKSKRRKRQQNEEEQEQEQELKPQPSPEPVEEVPENSRLMSSDSSISSSSDDESSNDSSDTKQAIGTTSNNIRNEQSGSNNSSSDDDSFENVMLSKLRDKLKTEPSGGEERKPLKRELPQPDAEQGGSRAKRRRSSSSNNSDLSRASSTLSSTSFAILTSAQEITTMNEIANSLIELSTVNAAVHAASDCLMNDQPVGDEVLSILRNTIYRDDSRHVNDLFNARPDALSDAQVDSIDANEDSQETELDVVHDDADEEEHNRNESDGDNDDEDDDDNENDNDNDNDNEDEDNEEENINASDDAEDSENSDSD